VDAPIDEPVQITVGSADRRCGALDCSCKMEVDYGNDDSIPDGQTR
jgi:hypothetical protein